MKRALLWIFLFAFLWGSQASPVGADSGYLRGLSVTAAKVGPLDVDFTVKSTTLTSTTSPFVTTSFGGTLDFGDGATTSGFTMDVTASDPKMFQGAVAGFTNNLQGVVSHSYPAPGTYTATVTECCKGKFKTTASSVYVTTVTPTVTFTDTTTVVLKGDGGGGACTEQTRFAQLNCLLTVLSEDVSGAGLDADTTSNLLEKLTTAKTKKEEAEVHCQEGDPDKAQTKMSAAKEKIKNFIDTVSDKQKAGKIPQGTADDFTLKAEEIQALIQELLDAGVCALGSACLPDPPLPALNCELDQLIGEATAAGLDAKLIDKLIDAKSKKEEAELACGEGKDDKAGKKLKGAQSKVTSFAKKVRTLAKKGKIPQDVADALATHADAISTRMSEVLQAGVCTL
jgi:hypothetical protein